jgi:hypothetical protein
LSLKREKQFRTVQCYTLRGDKAIGLEIAGGIFPGFFVFLGVPAAKVYQVVTVSFLLLDFKQGILNSGVFGG